MSPASFSKSAKLARRERRKRLTAGAGFLAVAALIFFLIAFFSNLQALRVTDIEVDGNVVLKSDEIKEAVMPLMQKKLLRVISLSNVFLYPDRAIRSHLLQTFGRIETVKLELKDPHTVLIVVKERKPLGLWCAAPSGPCYFLDKGGLIFDDAPQYSGAIFIRFYGEVSEDPIGTYYLPTEFFKKITLFMEELRELGFKVATVRKMDQGDFEIVMTDGLRILFSEKQNFSKTFSNLESTLREIKVAEEKELLPRIDYIDLRFGNKIFYKEL